MRHSLFFGPKWLAMFAVVSLGVTACGGSNDASKPEPGDWPGAGSSASSGGSGGDSGHSGDSGDSGDSGVTACGPHARPSCDTPTPVAEWASWPMPNPPSAGLPNPQSYTDNGDGTVLDNVTGLVWQQRLDASQYTSANAKQHCLERGAAWRLPTTIELVSLVDYTRSNPTIDTGFFPANTLVSPSSSLFLSSSPMPSDPFFTDFPDSWVVDFYGGATGGNVVASPYMVRCVSDTVGGSAAAFDHYSVVSEGVKDNATGLVWQQPISEHSYTFADAAGYCPTLGAGWRVPTVTELQTLVDRGRQWPSIDPKYFPNAPRDSFWTSSPSATDPGYAHLVDFDGGFELGNEQDLLLRVRCVR